MLWASALVRLEHFKLNGLQRDLRKVRRPLHSPCEFHAWSLKSLCYRLQLDERGQPDL